MGALALSGLSAISYASPRLRAADVYRKVTRLICPNFRLHPDYTGTLYEATRDDSQTINFSPGDNLATWIGTGNGVLTRFRDQSNAREDYIVYGTGGLIYENGVRLAWSGGLQYVDYLSSRGYYNTSAIASGDASVLFAVLNKNRNSSYHQVFDVYVYGDGRKGGLLEAVSNMFHANLYPVGFRVDGVAGEQPSSFFPDTFLNNQPHILEIDLISGGFPGGSMIGSYGTERQATTALFPPLTEDERRAVRVDLANRYSIVLP